MATTVPDHEDAVRVVVALRPADPVAALVHLLTPRSVAVGLGARLSGGRLQFRDLAVPVDAADLAATAAAVAAAVRAVSRADDTFCDLSGPPVSWLKALRSGAHVLLAGAVELFGAPVVRLEPSVAARGVVLEPLAAAVVAGTLPRPGDAWAPHGVVFAGNAEVLDVRERRRSGTARSATGDLLLQAAQACTGLDDALGAVAARWVPQPPLLPGTVRVLGSLELPDGSQVEVPLTQGPASQIAGVCGETTVPALLSDEGVPDGFVPYGIRLADGVNVVEHAATGVRAALTRRADHDGGNH